MAEVVDVLVIGAGLSGVAAGYYLQKQCPHKRYAILEMRERIGGTWDLFRYPGVRCDSDMFSLGYPFRPWPEEETIADAASIRDYIEETAREFGIDRHIRYRHKVVAADFSSAQARWHVVVERTDTGERVEFVAGFVISCTGYYDYDEGYTPEYPGRARFRGRFVHPQGWTDDVDYAGKTVVVIGSGATAVTMVPALAARAAKVYMLQRSPSYALTVPRRAKLTQILRRALPASVAPAAVRWKNILLFYAFHEFSRRFPARARKSLMDGARAALGSDYDVDTHFNPRYQPWDERLCMVPDGDLFDAIAGGRAEVVTDHIETFTEAGIRLRSGRHLDADLVVSATGLNIKALGGVDASVDGVPIVAAEKFFYRGAMFSDVPNFAMVIGYTNAAWTLKVEVVHRYVCRILQYMDRHGYDTVVPRLRDASVEPRELIELTSGYVQRVRHLLPKNGSKHPWRLYQNFIVDRFMLGRGKLDDGALEFGRRT